MAGSYTLIVPGGTSGAPAPMPSQSSLGAQDNAGRGALYYVEDFNQPYNTTSPQITSFVSGTGNVAGCGTNGVAYPPAEMVNHPGNACVSNIAVGYSQFGAANSAIPAVSGSGITTTWNITFRSPDVISNSTDSYEFRVGTGLAVGGTYNGPGVGLYFTDTYNSGNWGIFAQYPANEAINLVQPALSIAPIAGTWYNMQVIHGGANSFSVSLNGYTLGSITDGSFVPGTIWNMAAGSMLINRKTVGSTPPRITALMDRCAVYMTGLNR